MAWQPTPGLTEGEWKRQVTALNAVGSRGYNGQLYGKFQPGDQGYNAQNAADYDAMQRYGAAQGWVQPHKASWSSLKDAAKAVAPVVLAGVAGAGLSGAFSAGAGTAGVSGSGLGGASGTTIGAAAPGAAGSFVPGTLAAGLATVTGAGKMTAGGFFGLGKDILGTALGANALFGDPLGLGGDDGSDASQLAAQISADQWNYYKENYRPLEQNLIKQAIDAGSPEEFERARGVANADVTGSFDRTRKDIERDMQAAGINPASPAYVGNSASVRIAEGGARAGALTAADNLTRDRAYSKGLDVVGLGKGIPAQSAASSLAAGNSQFLQNQENMKNQGTGLSSLFDSGERLYGAAKKWFGNEPASSSQADQVAAMNSGWSSPSYWKDGGLIPVLKEKGFSDDAMKALTPHMRGLKRYASGGEVGLEPTGEVVGPGTGTSDSVPATIDGTQPAALSSGEFVVNEAAVAMTGEEILEAINQAGLQKRQGRTYDQEGIEQRPAAPTNPMPAYRHGGRVSYARGGKVSYGLGMR